MFCTNCGTLLPDGSKFCTNCGAAQDAPADNAPTYEPASAAMPEVPPVPDPVAPADPWFPDPTPDPEPSEETTVLTPPASQEPFAAFDDAVKDTEYAAPAYSAPRTETPPRPSFTPPAEPAAPNSGGWSIPGSGGGYTAPAAAPVSTREKPKNSKTGTYIALGAVAVVVIAIIAIVGSLVARSGSRTETPAAPQTAVTGTEGGGFHRPELPDRAGTSDLPIDASVDDILADALGEDAVQEILDDLPAAPEEPAEAPAEEPAAEGAVTAQDCMDYFDALLHENYDSYGVVHWTMEADEDYKAETGTDWIDIYIWEDGIMDYALAAYDGDEDALVEWNWWLRHIAQDTQTMQDYLDENLPDAVACINLTDEDDPDFIIALALDGEVIYDQVTGIDLWGIMEDAEEG